MKPEKGSQEIRLNEFKWSRSRCGQHRTDQVRVARIHEHSTLEAVGKTRGHRLKALGNSIVPENRPRPIEHRQPSSEAEYQEKRLRQYCRLEENGGETMVEIYLRTMYITGNRCTASGGTSLSTQADGSLNPSWVYFLSLYPAEYTDLKSLGKSIVPNIVQVIFTRHHL